MFMSDKPIARKTVADIILEKLTEKKTEIATQMNDDDRTINGADVQLDERIVRMYSQIKEILRKYRSGKLPKAFKILPSLNNWEHVSGRTAESPSDWSRVGLTLSPPRFFRFCSSLSRTTGQQLPFTKPRASLRPT